MSVTLVWPWLLLLAPVPWLVWRHAPAARPAPRPALRVPFFDELAGVAPAEAVREPPAARTPSRVPGVAVWALLLLAASRPLTADGQELYAWPLAAALLLAFGGAFATLRPTRRPRPLPGAGRGGAR